MTELAYGFCAMVMANKRNHLIQEVFFLIGEIQSIRLGMRDVLGFEKTKILDLLLLNFSTLCHIAKRR